MIIDLHKAKPEPIEVIVEQDTETTYSVADVSRLFDLPESRLRYWSQTGFITPSVRKDARRFYCFQDLLSVKVAKELLEGGQPLQRVRRSLEVLKATLPRVESPLARLRISNREGRIVVEEGSGSYEATTGQLLLDFDVSALRHEIAEVLHLPWVVPEGELSDTHCAYDVFLEAQELEARWDGEDLNDTLIRDAMLAYQRTVELDPGFSAAWNNLGSLAAQAGELEQARDYFDQALSSDPEQPEAQCNLAELALREGDLEVSLAGFCEVLNADPDHIEAHYGLARGYLAQGKRGQALAHLEHFCRVLDALHEEEYDDEIADRKMKAQDVMQALRLELGG